MRIFIASGIFHPESGGPATYLHHLLPDLQKRGHDVTALTFGDSVSDWQYPYSLTRIPRRGYLMRQWDYYHAAARLWPGHDVAYIHSLGLPLPGGVRPRIGKIVGDVAWERAINRGWVPANTDIDDFQQQRYQLQIEINKLLRAREAQRLDAIITPSHYLKRLVAGWGVDPAKIMVIYNALERGLDPDETQSEARQKLKLPDVPLVLTPARLTAWKGIDHSLHALAAVRDIYLIIAGDGPCRARWEHLAETFNVSQRVHFLGSVPHPQLAQYYRAADYTLLYSGYEGLSHTLLESLAAGTPVIASDKGGNPEIVQHGQNGILAPYPDPQALATALQDAFSPGRREQLRQNTNRGLERFERQNMVDQTVGILSSFG